MKTKGALLGLVVGSTAIILFGAQENEQGKPQRSAEGNAQHEAGAEASPPPCSCIRYPEFDFGSYVMYYAENHAADSNCAQPQAAYYNGDPGINEQHCNSTGNDRCLTGNACAPSGDMFTGFS